MIALKRGMKVPLNGYNIIITTQHLKNCSKLPIFKYSDFSPPTTYTMHKNVPSLLLCNRKYESNINLWFIFSKNLIPLYILLCSYFFTVDIFPYQEYKWIGSPSWLQTILFYLFHSSPLVNQLGCFSMLAIIKWWWWTSYTNTAMGWRLVSPPKCVY